MELQKINVKFFAAEPPSVPLTDFIDLFHRWIQTTDGAYHDVADYSHIEAGPGIVLVANEANLSIDETGNRRGLLYNCKHRLYGSNKERLRTAVRHALENCIRLEEEPLLGGKLRFSGDELWLCVNDRLLAPNSQESFDEIKNDLESLTQALYGENEITFSRDPDPRQRFNIHIKAARSMSLSTLLNNLRDN
jgi:hypothetical protein